MSARLDDLLVLLATDSEVARSFEQDPQPLVERYGLDADDLAVLSAVRVDRRTSRPRALEERLSRSGLGFGAVLHDALQSGHPAPSGGADSSASHTSHHDTDAIKTPAHTSSEHKEGIEQHKAPPEHKEGADQHKAPEHKEGIEQHKAPPVKHQESPEKHQEAPEKHGPAPVTSEKAVLGAPRGHVAPATTGATIDHSPAGQNHGTQSGGIGPAVQTPGASAHPRPDHGPVDDHSSAEKGGHGDQQSAWVGQLREAVSTALRGGGLPSGGGQGQQMINQLAGIVATASQAGPDGVPGAPWAAEFAGFVTSALHLDPTTAQGAPAPSGALPTTPAHGEPDSGALPVVGVPSPAHDALPAAVPVQLGDASGTETPPVTTAVTASVTPLDVVDPAAGPAPINHVVATVTPVSAPSALLPTTAATNPTGAYHGGVVSQQVTSTNPDGGQSVQVTRGDGTSVLVERHTDASGDQVDTHEEADGTLVSATTGQGHGSAMITAADGSRIDRVWDSSTLHESDTAPDGSSTDIAWAPSGAPGGDLFSVTSWSANGQVTSTTTVHATADGGAVATMPDGEGGTTSVRLAVQNIDNADGSQTRIFGFPDGHTEAFTFDVTDAPVDHETVAAHVAPDAPVADSETVTAPDDPNAAYHGGEVGERVLGTNPDGSTNVLVTRGDGSTVQVHRAQDSAGPVDTYVDADGTHVVTQAAGPSDDYRGYATVVHADGSSAVSTWTGSTLKDTETAATGATRYVEWDSSPHGVLGGQLFSLTSVTPAGRYVTTVGVALDGTTTATVVDPHGASATATVPVQEIDNPDGSHTRVFTFPDGHTEAFTFDETGAPVAHETHAAGDASAPADQSSGDPVVSSGADGSRVETTTHADGSVQREEYLADGSWNSTVTGTDGTTVETSVAYYGVLVRTVTMPDGSQTTVTTFPSGEVGLEAVDAAGNHVTSSTHPDGTGASTTYVVATGQAISTSMDTDDGQTHTVTDPSGAWQETAQSQDGSWTATQHIADSDRSADSGGASQAGHTVVTTGEGDQTATIKDTAPDGSESYVARFSDGGVYGYTKSAGGLLVTQTQFADATWNRSVFDPSTGRTVEQSIDTSHTITTKDAGPGGIQITSIESPSGVTSQTLTDVHGNTVHATKDTNGNVSMTRHDADGSVSSEKDGVFTSTTPADDGSSTTLTIGRDGSQSVQFLNPDGTLERSAFIDRAGNSTVTQFQVDGLPGGRSVTQTPASSNISTTTATDGSGAVVVKMVTTTTGDHRTSIVTNAAGQKVQTVDVGPDDTVVTKYDTEGHAVSTTQTPHDPTPPPRLFGVDPSTVLPDGVATRDLAPIPEIPPLGDLSKYFGPTPSTSSPNAPMTVVVDPPLSGSTHSPGEAPTSPASEGRQLPESTTPAASDQNSDVAKHVVGGVESSATNLVGGVESSATNLVSGVESSATNLVSGAESSATNLVGGAESSATNLLGHVQGLANGLTDTAGDLASNGPGNLLEQGQDALGALGPADLWKASSIAGGLLPHGTYSAQFSDSLQVAGSTAGALDLGLLQVQGSASYLVALGASGNATLTMGPNGIDVSAAAQAYLQAQAQAAGSLSAGPLDMSGALEASAGGTVDADITGSLGTDGGHFYGGVDADIGAHSGGNAKLDLGSINASASYEVGFGLGGQFHGGLDFSTKSIGFEGDVGIWLGIGGDVHLDLTVDPEKIVGGVANIITHPADDLRAIGHTIEDVGNIIIHPADDIRAIGDTIGDAVDDVEDFFGL